MPFDCVSVFLGAANHLQVIQVTVDYVQINLQVLEVGQARCQVGQQRRQRLDSSHRLAERRDDSRSKSNEPAPIPHRLRRDILDDFKWQLPTLRRTHPDTCHMLEFDTDRIDGGDNPRSPTQMSHSGLIPEPLHPEPHLATNSSLSSQPEYSLKQQENTAVQTLKLKSAVPEEAVVEPAAGPGRKTEPENDSGLKVAPSPTLQSETGAWTPDKPPKGLKVTEVLMVLDREPQASQIKKSSGSGLNYSQGAELCEAKPNGPLNLGSTETGSSPCPAMISVETGQTGSVVHCLSESSPEKGSTLALLTSGLGITRRACAKLSHQDKIDTLQLVHGSASPDLHSEARRPAGARAAEATFLQVSHGAMTDLCHAEQQPMSSASLNSAEGGETHTESVSRQQGCLASSTPAAAGAGSSAMAEEINQRVQSESESCQSEAVNSAGLREQELASGEESLLEVSSAEDTKVDVNSPATHSTSTCVSLII